MRPFFFRSSDNERRGNVPVQSLMFRHHNQEKYGKIYVGFNVAYVYNNKG